MRGLFAGVVLAVALLAPRISYGHAVMVAPTPRNDDDGLKTGPCGQVAPTTEPNVFVAGEEIVVSWLETIDHPGYYRIAFSPAGDQAFDDHVLVDDVQDVECVDTPCNYQEVVTLPSEPCEGCSLQLIQWMGTTPPYSPYFSCADLTILPAPEPEPEPEDPGEDPGGGEDRGTQRVGGGCAATGPEGAAPSSLLMLLALWAAAQPVRPRRRRRSSTSSSGTSRQAS